MGNFRKIKNNTKNAITIHDVLIEPKSETILSESVFSAIDEQYFLAKILVDLGKYEPTATTMDIKTENVSINNIENQSFSAKALDGDGVVSEDELKQEGFYKRPSMGIPLSHFDRETRAILERAKRSSQVSSGLISLKDLSPELKRIIMSAKPTDLDGDGRDDAPPSSGRNGDISGGSIYIPIKEDILDDKIVRSLRLADKSYQKPSTGIPMDDLDLAVQSQFDKINESKFWLPPVALSNELPKVDNKDGDVRIVLEDNSLWRWNGESLEWRKIFTSTSDGNENVSISEVATVDPRLTNTVISEFFAYKGQKIVKFQQQYPFNQGNLMVQVNGIILSEGAIYDYVEIDKHTIMFNEGLSEGDYVVCYLTSSSGSPVYTQVIEVTNRVRRVKLQHTYVRDTGSLRVFLNGMQLNSDVDYVESSERDIDFLIDIIPGDRLYVRIESDSLSKNVLNQMSIMREVYTELANKVKKLQENLLY